jgi:hypothetical protein
MTTFSHIIIKILLAINLPFFISHYTGFAVKTASLNKQTKNNCLLKHNVEMFNSDKAGRTNVARLMTTETNLMYNILLNSKKYPANMMHEAPAAA